MKNTIFAAAIAVALTGCSETYLTDVAMEREADYGKARCAELGVKPDRPEWNSCVKSKAAARWATKTCVYPISDVFHPSFCRLADRD